MAGYASLERNRHLFPLKTVNHVLQLFKNELCSDSQEPDLAILSIVIGAAENSLTCKQGKIQFEIDETCDSAYLPILHFDYVESLYDKFHSLIKNSVDINLYKKRTFASRELVKRVSDVIWNTLTRSYYKDRAHLQSLYSYLTGNKLDCFGVAFAVVAGCQVLGFKDVHLALSEDHAWVVFGEDGNETAEVTWHGKGNEDKRGQSIGIGVSAKSWLYLNNHPVVCTRHTEVAAIVSAINPSLTSSSDAYEVAFLQQELFWLLYDLGHLKKYPMALGNLGDLEEIAPSEKRPSCALLFKEAIESARTNYRNHHVYPYTYQGGYFYRHQLYKLALDSWASAADVIRLYNYSRDDEEIYKEFLEIANDLIPYVMKIESSGHSARSILKDPECFAHLLRFYDGICQWEEGSATPVLHIGWVKPLVNTISKFDASVRAQLVIICADANDIDNMASSSVTSTMSSKKQECDKQKYLNNNNYESSEGDLVVGCSSSWGSTKNESEEMHPSLEALTAACSQKILNPKYLLQGGVEPFVRTNDATTSANDSLASPSTSSMQPSPKTKTETQSNESVQAEAIDKQKQNNSINTQQENQENNNTNTVGEVNTEVNSEVNLGVSSEVNPEEEEVKQPPTVLLRSQKMIGLKDLLLSEKLNTQAIELQLTAQSQVQVGGKRKFDSVFDTRPKRMRRD